MSKEIKNEYIEKAIRDRNKILWHEHGCDCENCIRNHERIKAGYEGANIIVRWINKMNKQEFQSLPFSIREAANSYLKEFIGEK